MRLIDEIAYQIKIAKIPLKERTFVKAWETARHMPTIDATPVVRGEWVPVKDPYDRVYCYRHRDCGCEHNEQSAYCPNCGAKMEDKT